MQEISVVFFACIILAEFVLFFIFAGYIPSLPRFSTRFWRFLLPYASERMRFFSFDYSFVKTRFLFFLFLWDSCLDGGRVDAYLFV